MVDRVYDALLKQNQSMDPLRLTMSIDEVPDSIESASVTFGIMLNLDHGKIKIIPTPLFMFIKYPGEMRAVRYFHKNECTEPDILQLYKLNEEIFNGVKLKAIMNYHNFFDNDVCMDSIIYSSWHNVIYKLVPLNR